MNDTVAGAALRLHERYGSSWTRRLAEALDRLAYIESGIAASSRQGFALAAAVDDACDWLDADEYPAWAVEHWSEPTGFELAGPEGQRYQQRTVSRGSRKGESGWYDTQGKRFMPKDWQPSKGERKAKDTAPKPKAEKPAKPSPDGVHDAIQKVQDGGGPVTEETVRAIVETISSLTVDGVKQLRAKLGMTKGKGTKDKLARELARSILGPAREADPPPLEPPETPPSAGDAPLPESKALRGGLPADGEIRKLDYHPPLAEMPEDYQNQIDGYSADEKAAVLRYMGSAASYINTALRNWLPPITHYGTYRALQSAFAKTKPFAEPVTVFRGMRVSSQAKRDKIVRDFQTAAASGKEVEMRGFVSTGLSPQVGIGFGVGAKGTGQTRGLVFEIVAKKGIVCETIGRELGNASQASSAQGERELLLDHKSKFRVVAVKKVKTENPYGNEPIEHDVIQLEQLIDE